MSSNSSSTTNSLNSSTSQSRRLELSPQKLNLLVGGFVLIGMLALVFFALKVSQFNHAIQGAYSVYARFDNIGTLKEGASIKSAGVIVGRVKKISFNDSVYQAQLELELDKTYKFPSDSQFKIMTTGLLGDQFIALEAGSETTFLQSQQSIENTQSAMVLEDLIGKFLYSKASEAGKSSPEPSENLENSENK